MEGQMSKLMYLGRLPSALRIELTLLAVAFLALSTMANAQKAAVKPTVTGTSVRTQLIGSWRLVSRQSRRANGELEPDPGLSTVPLGILIYDQSGHVAAQLSRRDRTVAIIGEECQTAVTTGIVTHHLEAALFPEDIGKDIGRHFTISGDKLTISFNTITRDGVKVTRTVIWERMK
jgi:hypothetical protein